MNDEKIFEKVCRILSIEEVFSSRTADFASVCKEVGVGCVKMNNILYERMGLSGNDILTAFRNGNAEVSH